jgi:hypothetical protein
LGRVPGTYQGEVMKKQTKKLELAKERLQNLENLGDKNLELVVGGRPKTTIPTIC